MSIPALLRSSLFAGAAAASVSLSGAAQAEVILSQGFEDTSTFQADTTTLSSSMTGDRSSVGGGWWTSTNGVTPPQIVRSSSTSPVHSGSQSLEINKTSPTTHIFGINDQAGATSGKVEVSFYFNRTTGSGFTSTAAQQNKWYVGNIPSLYVIADGRFAAYNSVDRGDGNPGWQTLASGLSADTWYGAKMVIDLDAKTYDAYLDQGSGFVLLGDDIAFTNDPGAIQSIQMGPAVGKAYIDDITMIVPEPATFSLLGLGALVMLRRQ